MKKLLMIVLLIYSSISFSDQYSELTKQNNLNDLFSQLENNDFNLDRGSSSTESFSYSDKDLSERDKVIEMAKSKLGSKYVWGATGPNTFDCSGYTQYVFNKAADIRIPRVSQDQSKWRPQITKSQMKKGDLVFFETTGQGRISHVGIYLGNNQFIHSSSGESANRVTISSLEKSYYQSRFRWAINPFS